MSGLHHEPTRTVRAGRRSLTAAVAAIAVAAFTQTALAPPAAAAGALTVTAVTLGAPTVAVSGLAVGRVTVTVAATIDPTRISATDQLVARLVRTSVQPNEFDPAFLWVPMPRTGGADDAHGIYSGQAQIPSTANGTWRVDRVAEAIPIPADPWGNNPITTDVRADGIPDQTLTVKGTHRPVLTLTQSPLIPWQRKDGTLFTLTFTGRVRYSDTGAPVAGLQVGVNGYEACYEGRVPQNLTTTRNGSFSIRQSVHDVALLCVASALPGTPAGALQYSTYHRFSGSPLAAMRVSAALKPTSIELGTQAAVTGTVSRLMSREARPDVVLQKYVGRTWVTVNRATVRASGRYTLAVRPGSRGTFRYRVWLPTQRPYAGTVSRQVSLRVR